MKNFQCAILITLFGLCAAKSLWAGSVVRADLAKITLDGRFQTNGGLVYSPSTLRAGELRLYKMNHETGEYDLVKVYGVNVRLSAVGVTLFLRNRIPDSTMTLANIDGKRISDILGEYYGLQLGGGTGPNGHMRVGVNRNVVFIGDMESGGYGIGLGIDLSVHVMTIYKSSRKGYYDFYSNNFIRYNYSDIIRSN